MGIKFPAGDRLSSSPIRLSLRRNDGHQLVERAHCTGFLVWTPTFHYFLITNWHAVTGWHADLDQPLDGVMGFEPELIAGISIRAIDRNQRVVQHDLEIPLRDQQGPRWLEHPTFGRKVDVVAFPLGFFGGITSPDPINQQGFDDVEVAVGDEAFVIGFPLNMDGGDGLPIWKRASIATEPHVDPDGLPKILIDTATRQGMSGSPVIAVQRGFYRDRWGEAVIGANGRALLGVYSSRIGDDPLGVQLGTVWKASVIWDIIDNGVKGRGPHDV